jgi:transposase
VIAHGLPIYVALEPVDMRLGAERLGGIVREKMRTEPRARALFVFVGKRGHTMKVLTWDGTGTILLHKKLDAGRFELPRATEPGEQHLQISSAIFDVIHRGVALTQRTTPRKFH